LTPCIQYVVDGLSFCHIGHLPPDICPGEMPLIQILSLTLNLTHFSEGQMFGMVFLGSRCSGGGGNHRVSEGSQAERWSALFRAVSLRDSDGSDTVDLDDNGCLTRDTTATKSRRYRRRCIDRLGSSRYIDRCVRCRNTSGRWRAAVRSGSGG